MENFARTVHEYSPRLIGLAMRIVGDRAAAEDVVQEALVKAFSRLSEWRGEARMSTWLYTIVYRQAISTVRGRRFLERELPADVPDEEAEFDPTDENIDRMRRALSTLPAADRALVQLFYIDERPVRECALVVGQSEANVKVRLHRIRARLREELRDKR